jgi:hypothetical protein
MKHTESDDDESDLNGNGANSPVYRGRLFPKAKDIPKRHIARGILVLLVVLFGFLWLVVDSKEEASAEKTEAVREKSRKIPQGFCNQFCKARLDQREKHHGGDFLKAGDLLSNLKSAKADVEADLKLKYGQYYDKIMLKGGKWRQAFQGANPKVSGRRFRRKLKMKILQMQVAIRKENENLEGCNCNPTSQAEGSSSGRRRLDATRQIVLPDLPQTYSKFVWATGGHSAAAGHGNLYNETYTAMLEQAAKGVFKAVGIELDARNYAMGGMKSAPEVALCQESIFGTDADVITWDFGACISLDVLFIAVV